MKDLMKSFKRYYDTCNEMGSIFNTEVTRKEYSDLNIRSINGERFACRDYLSDFYSNLTEEQKDLIAKFQVVFGSAILEDKHDKKYNLKNYEEMNNNFSMKVGIVIGK